jgi:peroxiredoxin Q/BCP
MKLKAGQVAPQFIIDDIWGNVISLREMQSQKILLSFFRYAECAMCNVQVSHIVRAQQNFQLNNIKVIAVFESPAESLRKSIADRHHFSFPIIADVNRTLYDLYHVTPSWTKTLRTVGVKGFKHLGEAIKSGYKIGGKVEGTFHQIPADFLIDKNGVISIAHYGSSVVGHLPLENIFPY